jgi:hypothetical protein
MSAKQALHLMRLPDEAMNHGMVGGYLNVVHDSLH